MLTVFKLILAGFLVFLNIFSFLLVKCQKNDREKKLLEGIAEGNPSNIDFEEKNKKPNKEEQDTALNTLNDDSNNGDSKHLPPDTENEMPKDTKQKKEEASQILDKFSKKPVSAVKLFLCALLGGSLGIYAALFIFRYRLRDISMMVLVPTILVFNVYIYLQLFTVWLNIPFANNTVFMPVLK